jgi:3-keto-L-gulonate-6-phosphate decarboxylase
MAKNDNSEKIKILIYLIIFIVYLATIQPAIGLILFIGILLIIKVRPEIKEKLWSQFSQLGKNYSKLESETDAVTSDEVMMEASTAEKTTTQSLIDQLGIVAQPIGLPVYSSRINKGKKYLQVALNGSMDQAREVLSIIPPSEKIIIEAGTPLIKSQGVKAIRQISYLRPGSYIVADIKTADLAEREVVMCAQAGASAVTCLGVAPVETINEFINACQQNNVDSMIDMMNAESPLTVLKKLKKMPKVVILHRGVDETESSDGKLIPFYQIKQIKGNYNVLVSVAGGDTLREVQSAIFNNADIVVVWKNFTQKDNKTEGIVSGFLKQIR